jgi:hypothetical protein
VNCSVSDFNLIEDTADVLTPEHNADMFVSTPTKERSHDELAVFVSDRSHDKPSLIASVVGH